MSSKAFSGTPIQVYRRDTAVTNITTAAWSELVPTSPAGTLLADDVSEAEVFNSTGEVLKLAIGSSGAEVEIPYYIVPGGEAGRIGFLLNKDMRLFARAVSANATAGDLILNLLR